MRHERKRGARTGGRSNIETKEQQANVIGATSKARCANKIKASGLIVDARRRTDPCESMEGKHEERADRRICSLRETTRSRRDAQIEEREHDANLRKPSKLSSSLLRMCSTQRLCHGNPCKYQDGAAAKCTRRKHRHFHALSVALIHDIDAAQWPSANVRFALLIN